MKENPTSTTKKILNFFSLSIVSNLVALLVSMVTVIVIPKFSSVNDYSLFQLYIFYLSYVGILHFGLNDGIYLKYGGKNFRDLNYKLIQSQFFYLTVFEILLMVVLLTFTKYELDADRKIVYISLSIALVITNTKLFTTYLLQATARVREFVTVTIIDRVVFLLFIIVFLMNDLNEFKYFIYADLIGRLLSLFLSIYFCKSIILARGKYMFNSINEIFENISIGSKLMFSNFAGILVLGIVRFGIERNWDLETFGKVSLALSACSMVLVFVNGIGMVVFPLLRRVNEDSLKMLYKSLITLTTPILALTLIIYYPASLLFDMWLPAYKDTLTYMIILFPFIFFEGKMHLIFNPFFKTMRMEKIMFSVNIRILILSILFTLITTYVLVNINLAVFSLLILVWIRSLEFEKRINEKYGYRGSLKRIKWELLLIFSFIVCNFALDLSLSFFVYLIIYVTYIFFNLDEFKKEYFVLKKMI